MSFLYHAINFKYNIPPSYGLAYDNYFWKKIIEEIEMQKYTDSCKVLNDYVDDETNWFYYHDADHRWTHLKNCWEATKEKYFEYLKEKNVVVTAGGHVGLYVRFYSKIFKRVYAFEPNPESFHCMVNNAATENVVKIQAALGECNGLVKMEGWCPMSLQAKVGHEDAFVPTFTIDSLSLNDCSLIQLDVENYEYKALLGAKNTIQKYHPVIILENGDTQEITNLLTGLNYKKVDRVQYDDIWIYDEKA